MFQHKLLIAAVISVVAGHAFGVEFQPIGSRSISMGGAGVASARGPYAVYYNPALLTRSRHTTEVGIGAGIGIRERNMVDSADRIAELDLDDTFDALEAFEDSGSTVLPPGLLSDIRVINQELVNLSGENGLQLMPSISVGVNAAGFGFGLYGVSEATAYAVIQPDYLDFIVWDEDENRYYSYDTETGAYGEVSITEYEASSLQYAIDNGLTYLQLTGVAYAEIPVGYGHAFDTDIGIFSVGGSLKVMPGMTYDLRVDVDTESGELEDLLSDSEEQSTAFGVDLGVLYTPSEDSNLSVGLVAKNVNGPSFDLASGGSVDVDPMARAGMAYDFVDDMFTVAVDVDLTANDTFIPGVQSQQIGGGLAYHPRSWCSLRVGAMQDIKDDNDGLVYTAGLGLGLKWFQLDVSAQMSADSGEYDGQEIPRYARAQIALTSKWD